MAERLISKHLLERLEACEPDAIEDVYQRVGLVLEERKRMVLAGCRIHPAQFAIYSSDPFRIWRSIVDASCSLVGAATNDDTAGKRKKLLRLAERMSGFPCEHDNVVTALYNLAIYALFIEVKHESAVGPVIASVFCEIERSAAYSQKIFEREWYMGKAKGLFLHSLKNGSERVREDAAIALKRFWKDDEVKSELVGAARNDTIPPSVRGKAVESIIHIRSAGQLEEMRRDRARLLLESAGSVEKSAYIEGFFRAVEAALVSERRTEHSMEVDESLVRFAVFAKMPLRLSRLFGTRKDEEALGILRKHAENALLRLFSCESEYVRNEAGAILTDIGGPRIEGILRKMSQREGEESELAFDAQSLLVRMVLKRKQMGAEGLQGRRFCEPARASRAAEAERIAGEGLRERRLRR